ncbi:glycosyl transferase, family 2 [Shewanella sediminis HAW-EB3]|uniref:Glycosyl transferase, family 2 n=1 Tax=Shewanella sediminis (strain HAW-EB3) TaxID=425104 RepID=A8FXM5_SHESH|nr:glycosyltransferase family 2 protein [Shewanella sediminis]ABV37598.1 glycosyl transferase, family 2 [Shewanella sediminis HAW-EB3]
MQGKQITFTIPFYENEILLKKTVESVLAQSIPDWLLIISLDSKLSNEFISYLRRLNDNRISVIENESSNKGICGNWNNCIDSVESEYVTILHSDDELIPNYIVTMLEAMNEAPDNAFYFCAVKVIDINSQATFSFADKIKNYIKPNNSIVKLTGDNGLASLLKGCFIFCPSICYKTSVIKKYKFREKWKMVLDLDLYARLLFNGYSMYGTSKEAYRYRRHDNNQTAKLTKDFKRFDEEVLLYDDISRKAKKNGWKNTERVARNKTIIKLHLLFLVTKSAFLLNFKRCRQVLEYFLRLIKI